MTQSVFDKETLLDLTVNAIPLAIILFFIVVFAVMNPFGSGTVVQAVQFSILGVMFIAMTLLSYYSGKAIASAEQEMEEAEEATAPVEPKGALQGKEAETPEEYEAESSEAVSDVTDVDIADAEERVVHEEASEEPFEGEPDVEPGEHEEDLDDVIERAEKEE